MRLALSEAYVAVGKPSPVYADAIARGEMVMATHLSELRSLVRDLD
jgi:hypothetical protein